MFNIALGLAFLLSAIASPGGRLLGLFLDEATARALAPHERVLVTIIANYWIPATLIYAALRFTGLGTRLNPTRGIHALFTSANLILALYAALRVFTASVPGGGATFALATFAVLVAPVSWTMLAVATVWLLKRSMASDAPRSEPVAPSSLRASWALLGFLAVVPAAFFAVLLLTRSDEIARRAEGRDLFDVHFEELCASLRMHVARTASGVRSVYVDRPLPVNVRLLDKLDYTERRVFGREKSSPYERLVPEAGRPRGPGGIIQHKVEPIQEPSARYSITEIRQTEREIYGIQVTETQIVDNQEAEVLGAFTIARAPHGAVCPKSFRDDVQYDVKFVRYVLGLADESTARRIADDLRKPVRP